MRILCVTPWFPPQPQVQEGKFILDSVESLRALGHEVRVLVTRPRRPKLAGVLVPAWRTPPIEVNAYSPALKLRIHEHWSIPRNRWRGLSNRLYQWAVVPELRRLIDTDPPDLIHAHNELPASAALMAVGSKGPPVVITLHGVDLQPRLRTPPYQNFQRSVLNQVDRVILVGEPLRSHFSALADHHDHFRVVHNGCRMPDVERSVRSVGTGGLARLVSVSNLVEGKGIDLTLRALAKLDAMGRAGWTYTVVGDGFSRTELERLAQTLGIADRVRFVGACDHEEVCQHLGAAGVFVLPSYREAFGIAYLEAMAMGLLAIGVEGQGPAAFIRHGVTGLLVPPHNVDALATCLAGVLDAPVDYRPMAVAGCQLVRREFSWQRHAERLTEVFRESVPC